MLTEELENDCLTFLDTKFTRLRSALSAFILLKDFTTIASRPKINAKLGDKFVDILRHFSMFCSISTVQRVVRHQIVFDVFLLP